MQIIYCKTDEVFNLFVLTDLNRFLKEMEDHIRNVCNRHRLGLLNINCFYNPVKNLGVAICDTNSMDEIIVNDMDFAVHMEQYTFKFS